MSKLLILFRKAVGILFMLSAFYTWISYDYSSGNPLMFGYTFKLGFMGVIGQVTNWLFVCIQGVIGYGLFSYKKKKENKSKREEYNDEYDNEEYED